MKNEIPLRKNESIRLREGSIAGGYRDVRELAEALKPYVGELASKMPLRCEPIGVFGSDIYAKGGDVCFAFDCDLPLHAVSNDDWRIPEDDPMARFDYWRKSLGDGAFVSDGTRVERAWICVALKLGEFLKAGTSDEGWAKGFRRKAGVEEGVDQKEATILATLRAIYETLASYYCNKYGLALDIARWAATLKTGGVKHGTFAGIRIGYSPSYAMGDVVGKVYWTVLGDLVFLYR